MLTFFVKRLIFWQQPRGAIVTADNLIYVLQFVFDDLQHLLISLARSIKYFYNVELLYPLDKFQTNLISYRGNIKQKHHFDPVADTIKVMFLVLCFSIKNQICLKLVKCFCCYSASTKTSFFSCSELL